MAPWPLPHLALAAVVQDDDRATTVYTITGAKSPDGTVVHVDPGDGTTPVPVTLNGGTGSAEHRYSTPGRHTYTVTVSAPCPVLWPTWDAVPAAADSWVQVPELAETWADATRDSETAEATVTVDVGPATIWATVTPADPLPYVQVSTWTGDTGNVASWTVTRIAPEAGPDQNTVIWISSRPDAVSVEDHDAPLGVPVVYRLTVTYTDGTTYVIDSDPVMITGTRGCFLSDPMTGRAVPVEVVTWNERTRAARHAALEVIGRPDVVVISDVHSTPTGEWVLLTRSYADLVNLRSVLLASRLVLLRTQPASSLETVYAAVGEITEARYTNSGTDWRRMVTVSVQEIAPIPAAAKVLQTTWLDLAAAEATWTAVAASWPTWQDVGEWVPG